MDLRSKSLSRPLDPKAALFLDSTVEDALLVEADILGSVAHVHGLVPAEVITQEEADTIIAALGEALRLARTGAFPLHSVHEDVHMNVEAWLTDQVGDLGKKVHTGRSRNDQVALDLRLGARAHAFALAKRTLALIDALAMLGAKAPDAVLPGFTHLQPAQPVAFAHWTSMHAERLLRDLARIADAYPRVDVCPLGAAALAGTSFAVDPQATATRLGFQATFRNSMDAVSDRDFLVELASCEAQLLGHLSQLAEDVILYVTPAYGFLALPDSFATGSSIMPQKRNPDVFEVARGAAGTAIGTLVSALVALKGLPAAYNRDLQEQKRLVLSGWARTLTLLDAVAGAVAGLVPVPEKMADAAGQGYTDATEVADHLVRAGVPFRTAHAAAATLVKAAQNMGVPLGGLPGTAFSLALGELLEEEWIAALRDFLGPTAAAAAKTSPGGTAPLSVLATIRAQKAERDRLDSLFGTWADHVGAALSALFPPGVLLQEVTAA